MSITLTRRAAEQIKQSLGNNTGASALRIAAQRKPDGSIDYAMGLDEATMSDTQLHYYGVDVVVSPTSDPLLEGATLDFVELDGGGQQFIFLNPNDPNYVPPRLDDGGGDS